MMMPIRLTWYCLVAVYALGTTAVAAPVMNVRGLAGVSLWILKDFPSPRRMNWKYQQYWNRKGLVSPEGHKKAAFYVLRDWYGQLASTDNSGAAQ